MSLDGRYFDMDGQPITMMEWAREPASARQVASDERDGIHVSTVLLGLNHNYGDGPPLIFETMIFGGEHDEYQERYATKEEAEAGHRRALALAFPSPAPSRYRVSDQDALANADQHDIQTRLK